MWPRVHISTSCHVEEFGPSHSGAPNSWTSSYPPGVYPLYDHARIAEMPDCDRNRRIEIRACRQERGAKCPYCSLTARRLAFQRQLMFMGYADVGAGLVML